MAALLIQLEADSKLPECGVTSPYSRQHSARISPFLYQRISIIFHCCNIKVLSPIHTWVRGLCPLQISWNHAWNSGRVPIYGKGVMVVEQILHAIFCCSQPPFLVLLWLVDARGETTAPKDQTTCR